MMALQEVREPYSTHTSLVISFQLLSHIRRYNGYNYVDKCELRKPYTCTSFTNWTICHHINTQGSILYSGVFKIYIW